MPLGRRELNLMAFLLVLDEAFYHLKFIVPMKTLLSLFFLSLLLSACDRNQKDPCATDFNQQALLENLGNNHILPRYLALQQAVVAMEQSAQNFTNSPSATGLDSLRNHFRQAYLAWQAVAIFEFGPAENLQLRAALNSFPLFVQRLEDGVSSGTYDLETPAYGFARGFPALDYLLFHTDSPSLLTAFGNANRKAYLLAVIAQLKTKVNAVVDAWQQGYLATFTTTTGVATGTPISLLVNQLSAHFETIKNERLGTPLGAKVSYVASPERVEAYYSGWSIDLALAAIEASQGIFQGGSGQGLDDYLQAAGAEKDGRPLVEIINAQYQTALQGLRALQPATLADAIANNNQAARAAYAHVLNQVVYLKTDLPSVLCVSITYIDNVDDGD